MKNIWLVATLLISVASFAQKDLPEADDNFMKYLDDGLKTDADADVRLSIFTLMPGFLELNYEHRLNHTFSIQASGGLNLFEGLDPYENWSFYSDETIKSGQSIGLAIKMYPGEEAISQMSFRSLSYRLRAVDYETFTMNTQDIYYTRGKKHLLGKSISAELGFGGGIRLYNATSKVDKSTIAKGVSVILVSQLSFGYYINY